MVEGFAGLFAIGFLFLFVLAVLWFLMPFAIFGTKGKLNQLIVEARVTNRALRELVKEMTARRLNLKRRREPALQGR
jgi:cytochrome b subunit of formate dehydrogenase